MTKTSWEFGHLFISPSEYTNGTATGSQKNGCHSHRAPATRYHHREEREPVGEGYDQFVAASNGVRVVPFNLHGTLRVQSVTGAGGQALSFIQEDKK